jgi:hypothetical protein
MFPATMKEALNRSIGADARLGTILVPWLAVKKAKNSAILDPLCPILASSFWLQQRSSPVTP